MSALLNLTEHALALVGLATVVYGGAGRFLWWYDAHNDRKQMRWGIVGLFFLRRAEDKATRMTRPPSRWRLDHPEVVALRQRAGRRWIKRQFWTPWLTESEPGSPEGTTP